MEGSALLSVSGVSKRFGERAALRDTGFTLREGEILGVIGPNGSGKTTLLACVAGLLPADAGEVRVRGEPVAPMSRKETLFFLPDGIRPWPAQSVARMRSLFVPIAGGTPGSSLQSSGLLPDAAGLSDQAIGSLSKGELKRVLLSFALRAPQPVLFFDEPFDGLDLRKTREVMAALRRSADAGRALVVSLHQLADAERFCDRMVLLSDGRTAAEGSLPELLASAGLSGGSLEDVFLALA